MKKLLLLLLVFLWAMASPVYGAMELSMDQAIELALANNEELKQAEEDQFAASDLVKQARGAMFPRLEGSYQFNHYFEIKDIPYDVAVAPNMAPDGSLLGLDGENPPSSDNPLGWNLVTIDVKPMMENEHVFGLTASQALYTSGRVMNFYRSAKAGKEGADYNYNRSERGLTLQVQGAYLDVLLARQSLSIAKASLKNSLYDHDIILQKLNEGLASEFDLMQHEVEVYNRKIAVITSENNLTLAKNQLKLLMGISLDKEVELTDLFNVSFPDYEFEEILPMMLEVEPSLKGLRQAVKAKGYMVKFYKSDYYPIVSAFGSAQYSVDSNDLYPEGEDFDELMMAGIQVTIPIYEGGVKGAKKNQAIRDLSKTKLELSKIQKLLTVDLQNAYLAYNASQREMESAGKSVEVAEKAYELAQLRYKTGMGSLSELQDAELAVTNVKLFYSKTIRDVNLNLYKIQSYISEDPRSKR
jgi:outer membrane protein